MSTKLANEIYVGQGLERQTYQDALSKRLNPNGNGVGKLRENLENEDCIQKWIKEDERHVLSAITATA